MCLAMPGRVLSVDATGTSGRVDILGTPRTVNLSLVNDVVPGEWVLVRMGSAVARMSPADAAETVALFEELDAMLAGSGALGSAGDAAGSPDASPGEFAGACDPEGPVPSEGDG